MEYEKKKFTKARGRTKYHGPPSGAVDAAWDDLYKCKLSTHSILDVETQPGAPLFSRRLKDPKEPSCSHGESHHATYDGRKQLRNPAGCFPPITLPGM